MPGERPASRIRVLPEEVARLIAAGEVVERPASAVKELVENALDAGARKITVDVEGGPTRLLRVSDDGAGMTREELLLAVERHATSKIGSLEDLEQVRTLGFRGEALPAIGDVSRLRILTRPRDGDEGFALEVEGGRRVGVAGAARAPGTSVEVRDLFFNAPVRRRFLRTPGGELRAILNVLTQHALAHPAVHFVLRVDGRESLNLPEAPGLRERILAVYGHRRASELLPVSLSVATLRVDGFLGLPETARPRGEHQVFFVNHRPVSNPTLKHAVKEAYGDLVPRDRYPFAVLSIEVDPSRVDVNIHPAKREIRFDREGDVHAVLVKSLRETVSAHLPTFLIESRGAGERGLGWEEGAARDEGPEREYGGARVFDLVRELQRPIGASAPPTLFPGPGPGRAGVFPGALAGAATPGSGETAEQAGGGLSGGAAPGPAVWQLHARYIFAQIKGGLLIVDQHAAHERVLYEQALRRLGAEKATSQELLFPQVVDLSREEFDTLLEIQPALERLGFHLSSFGGTTVVVHGVPLGLRNWRDGALLRELVDLAATYPEGQSVEEKVAKSYACHAAVKSGEPLTAEEMNGLIDLLFGTSKPQGDPHGRPAFLRLPLEELDRRFGRA